MNECPPIKYNCTFPYTGINCDETYASALGTNYLIYHILFTLFATSILIASIIQNVRMWYYNPHLTNTVKFKRLFLYLLLLMSFLLFLQGIDPQGYNGIIPMSLDATFSNLCTMTGMILVLYLTYGMSWSLRTRPAPKWHKLLFIPLMVLSFVLTITFSVLQTTVSRHTYRGIKLICFSFILLISSGIVNYYFITLFKAVSEFYSLENIRILKIEYRTKFFLALYDIFAGFVILFQLVTGIQSLSGTDEIPLTLTMSQIVFPMCEFLGITLGLMFMNRITKASFNTSAFIAPPVKRDELDNF